MVLIFDDWAERQNAFLPESVDLHISYKEYSIIVQALKCFAIEWEYYDEVADAVNLVSEFKNWYKISLETATKKRD